MKTISITSVLALFLIILITSCTDFLTEDPKGQMPSDSFFNNAEELDAAINALYSVVATAAAANHTSGTSFLAGDDISTHPSSNKQPLREHDQYSVSDNNAWMSYYWQSRWSMVKAANFIINNAGRTPDTPQEDITSAIAQAHYWRAYTYFNLVSTWGEVPVMLEEMVDYNAPLVSREDIYDLIVSDLKIAEEGVPVQYGEAPYVRNGMNIAVSQGAVKATLAYVYMAMAGWPLNRGAEYYQLAAQKAEEVIDATDNGTYYYELMDEYRKVYSWEYNDQNPEVILGIYYNRDRTSNSSTLCDFLQDQIQGGWNDTSGEIKFWYDFPDGPRKEATYFPQVMLLDGILYDWWWDTDPASRAVVAPPFMKTIEGAVRGTEFVYTDPSAINAQGEKMHQVIRLSEVYCWYAEAVGRSGQINAKAVDALNRVRNRADGAETNIYSIAMTPEELAEAAYNEHGWEIAGYYWSCLAPRYMDMFRMYRVKDHFEFRALNPLIEVAPGIFRNEAVPVTGSWDDSKMYIPYPYADAILNPNLVK